MKLAKNWMIKQNNEQHLVLESTVEYLQISFSKKYKTYQLWVNTNDEYYEEQYPIILNLEEHQMICSIIEELWGNK
jgi:hypothetical protein